MGNKNIKKAEQVELEILEKKPSKKPIKKQSFLITILSYKPVLYFFFFIVMFSAIIISKDYIFSIISKNEYSKLVNNDNSYVSINSNNAGIDNILLSKKKLTQKVSSIIEEIDRKKIEQNKVFESDLNDLLNKEFKLSYSSINLFADWFYSYTTQYKIIAIGAKGIIDKYRGVASDLSLADSASIAISDYMSEHYKNIVLKPHLLEPSLQLALKKLIEKYRNQKNIFMKNLDMDFKNFIRNNGINLSEISYEKVYINWESSIANSRNLITYKDKDAKGGAVIVGGIATLSGIASSKVASATAGKALATKIIGKMGIKKLVSMSLPKLFSLAAGTVTFGVGTGVGLGADYLINEADEAMFRKSFINDTKVNLDNMKNNIHHILLNSKIIELMYERDKNIYKEFITLGNK